MSAIKYPINLKPFCTPIKTGWLKWSLKYIWTLCSNKNINLYTGEEYDSPTDSKINGDTKPPWIRGAVGTKVKWIPFLQLHQDGDPFT